MKRKILMALPFLPFLPLIASAHENYVLPQNEIQAGMKDYSLHVLDSLKDSNNLKIAFFAALGCLAIAVIYFWFQHSRAGMWFDEKLKNLEPVGHIILRLTLAASFFASAYTHSFLGPEISVFSLPLGATVHYLLYILGIMLLLGLFSEVVGAVSLVIILLATVIYKDYILTYFNYFGEFIALIFFGSKWFSLDKFIFGANKTKQKYKQWEIFIIRVTYGVSILYPAISIKLLHPIIIVEIVNRYHLNQFHWLFPQDPLLISLGTGLLQIAVGIALILGFQTRLNTLVTFILMLLSVIFFKEAVWPHYILLALALYLMFNNGGEIGLDTLIHKKLGEKNYRIN